MLKSTENFHVRCASILLLLLLLLLAMTLPAFASGINPDNEERITLTGSFDGTFELSSDESELFHLENIAPGDTWSGRIRIKNATSADMGISLQSITSNIEDLVLFNALTLDISQDGKVIYSGSYNTGLEPIMEHTVLEPKKAMILDVTVVLPTSVSNEVQGKEMDSTWIFNAYSTATDKPQTGENLIAPNTISLIALCIFLFTLLIVVNVWMRIRSIKKAQGTLPKEVTNK